MEFNFYNYINLSNKDVLDATNYLVNQIKSSHIPLFSSIGYLSKKDLDTAEYIKNNFKNLIIVGMGGSILNPKLMCSLSESYNKIKFISSIDINNILNQLKSTDLNSTAILLISKSGKSSETLFIYKFLLDLYNKSSISLKDKFYLITASSDSELYKNFSDRGFTILNHINEINGRFSFYSNVGLIPAIFCGIDYKEVILAAHNEIISFVNDPLNSSPYINSNFLINNKTSIYSLFSYVGELNHYFNWYTQISAESIGKSGKGFTPIFASGPFDQHTVLQHFLDGPKDKVFSLYFFNKQEKLNSWEFLSNQLLNDSYRSTLKLLVDEGIPLKEVRFDTINYSILSILVINSIIEILIYSFSNRVNPFTQSKVDELKYNILQLNSKGKNLCAAL